MRTHFMSVMFCATMLAVSCPAQERGKAPRLGFLIPASASTVSDRVEEFRQGLRDLGYVEGKNLVINYRSAEGKAERLADLAAELVSLKPDVIFTSSPQGAVAAKKATTTIPIVFVGVSDPVGLGIVSSLAQPGGNVTGLTNFVVDLSGKRLELIKESIGNIAPAAVLWNSLNPGNRLALKETEAAAQHFGVKLIVLDVRSPNDFDDAFQRATSGRARALLPLPDPLMNTQRSRLLDFAAKHRLPAMYSAREFVDAGGLMSYGPDLPALFRRGAIYVDKILKGTKPADLPVEQPMKFEFIINLKAAKQIGLTILPNVLVRADRVIR
jgi:putative ABC transport system substrate-binding protein